MAFDMHILNSMNSAFAETMNRAYPNLRETMNSSATTERDRVGTASPLSSDSKSGQRNIQTMKYYDDIGYRKGPYLACSDKAAALLTQCAWCNRMTQDGIAYGLVVEKDLTASHGICETCSVEVMTK